MEKQFTLTLTEKQGDLLIKGLAELPLKDSLPLVQLIQQEATRQFKAPEEETVVEEGQ